MVTRQGRSLLHGHLLLPARDERKYCNTILELKGRYFVAGENAKDEDKVYERKLN